MLDLVRFYKVAGHLSNVALVIKELAQEGNIYNLRNLAHKEKTTSVLLRLGYLLELVGFPKLATVIEHEIKKRKLKYILLRPEFHKKTGIKNSRWKLIINDTLEVE